MEVSLPRKFRESVSCLLILGPDSNEIDKLGELLISIPFLEDFSLYSYSGTKDYTIYSKLKALIPYIMKSHSIKRFVIGSGSLRQETENKLDNTWSKKKAIILIFKALFKNFQPKNNLFFSRAEIIILLCEFLF